MKNIACLKYTKKIEDLEDSISTKNETITRLKYDIKRD